MRRVLALFIALGGLAMMLPATAVELQSVPDGAAANLELADGSASVVGRTKTYIVQFKLDPGIAYKGGVAGYAATAPGPSGRYDAQSSPVQMYTQYLIGTHDKALKQLNARDRKIYSYCHTMNGFAARLTAEEAEQLRGNKDVMAVWEDFATDLNTNNSPDFLGLHDRREGLHSRHWLKGENVVVGVLDSGIVPNHPSFSDKREFPLPRFCDNATGFWERICDRLEELRSRVVYSAPPSDWTGECQVGEGWTEADCNHKLIGARWYVDGFLAGRGEVVEGEFLSPRDSSGHGSHTASTAAGNSGVLATFNGTALDYIEGMAPRARVAAYKVCWLSPGAANFSCFFSDSAAATDQAVADGVDVINFSVGTAAAFDDPQDIAFLNATSAGVFVARSGGNDGPGFGTINAGEPWVTSVAASTLSGTGFALAATVSSPAAVAGDYTALEGAITQPLIESGDISDDLVAADPIDACVPLANMIDGKIALIARGTCAFTDKVENAVNAGAAAVFMYSDSRPKTVMGGTATDLTTSIPGVMVDNAVGLAIVEQIDAGETVSVSLSAGNFTTEELEGNIMADFSSRGPYLTQPDWIAPDITAPGVRILAAYTPDQSDGSAGDIFSYLQGTSMSGPHIAGLAALVRQAHPDWSPAQVKSALMTTARQDVVKEDGVTPADPFDFGSGHVDPNKAIDPGLTYDAGLLDYLAGTCGTTTPIVDGETCDILSNALHMSLDPSDLNLPSIAIGELPGSQVITRTVTAVEGFSRFRWGNRYSSWGNSKKTKRTTYRVSVDAPPGFHVDVEPKRIRLAPGESASYDVTITNETGNPGQWYHGSLTWSDGKGHDVRSPISVNAVALIAPDEIASTGTDGSEDFDVTFGYSGDYTAGTHGLNGPDLWLSEVAEDPAGSFVFLGEGTDIAFLEEVPAGTALARWSTFNNYTSGNDDIDLYLYYCPNFSCTQIASSGNSDSNESVEVLLPLNDPNIDDPYLVFTHGFATENSEPATVVLFQQMFGLDDNVGNMVVTAPGSAVIGNTESINVSWSGLESGPGAKYLGAVSHSDANGLTGLTTVNIDNDPDGTLCDFGLCAPPPP